MQKIQIAIAAKFLFASLLLTFTSGIFQQSLLAQEAGQHKTSAHQGSSAEPLLIGDGGAQTGVAKFQGNFTAITVPSGQAFELMRETDCSLTEVTGSYNLGQSLSYAPISALTNFERELHTDAGLTTTVDSFPSGCSAPTTGLGTRPMTFVGRTTSGINVFIAIGYSFTFNTNALYILTGTNSFTLNTFAFTNAGALTTADLNGDGNSDLVIVSNGALSTAGEVFVMLGNADGTFKTAVPYATSGTTSLAAVVDDFNNDGKLDIVSSSDNGMISVLTGKGDGTFNTAQSFAAPTPSYPGSTATPLSLTNLVSADLRGVGKKDVIASNGLVLLGNGDGTFTAASSAAFPPLTSLSKFGPNLAVGDLNKDGKLDLAVATGADVFTYIGKGDGTFSPGLGYSSVNTDGFVAISDLDGDGNPDIYIGDANAGSFRGDLDDINVAYALMGFGDGTFSGAPTIKGAVGSNHGTDLGDVNGDGQQDMITPASGTANGLPVVFTVQLGTPKGPFSPVSTITLPVSITVTVSELLSPVTINTANLGVTSYAVGDLNGDGKADIAFVSNVSNYAVYFVALSNGDGTFSTPVAYGFPQIAAAGGFDNSTTINNFHIGDFNHDGKADIQFNFNDIAGPSGTYLQGIGVLPGKGDGTFGAPILTYSYNSTTTPPTDPIVGLPTVATVADLNKDGNPDLIAVAPIGGPSTGFGTALRVYLGKGDGTFAAPSTASTAANPGIICPSCSVVLADFNNDGKLDLATVGETTGQQGQISVSLGKGDGTFSAPTILNVSGGDAVRSAGIAAADFDGDGNVDLAFLDTYGVSGVYYGKGDGTFTSVTSNGTSYPKDLINLSAEGGSIALDVNKDGKPDIIVGNTILLNLQSGAPNIVTQANTATAFTLSSASITQGGSVTLTAIVTPATGSTVPTGTVVFVDGESTLASVMIDGTGKATYTTTALTAGSHSLLAVFGGSSTFLGSVSSILPLTVTPGATGTATTTTLTSSASSVVFGSSLTLTATVTAASGTAIPTGTVTFADNGTTLGTMSLDGTGKAALSISTLAVGSHSITASYGGATTPAAFTNSASSPLAVTVATPPIINTTTALASSVSGTAIFGTSITFTATVTPASGSTAPTGMVTFTDTNPSTNVATTLGSGTLSSGKATFTTSSLAVGSHSITASYGGATTFSSSSSTGQSLSITAVTAADFAISFSPATATVARGAGSTSTITVTPSGGFKNTVQLVVTGNPTYSSVSTTATSLTPADGVTPVTTALTFQASTTTTAQSRGHRAIELAVGLPLGLLSSVGLFGLGFRRRVRWPLQMIILAAAVLLTAMGCGGHSGASYTTTTNTPVPGTYTVTVTGTATVSSGAITHTATYTVTIQ